MMSYDEIASLIASRPKPLSIGIDGIPLSGKTTLAHRLVEGLGADILELDDFMKPKEEWGTPCVPSFPFDYMRYTEFCSAVRSLIIGGQCEFFPFDWENGLVGDVPKVIRKRDIVIVEGVSALSSELAPLYDLRIWIESDRSSMYAAAVRRGVGDWNCEWNTVFTPSVALYLKTKPHERADIIARGRAASGSAD